MSLRPRKEGLLSGSLFQHFIIISYLENKTGVVKEAKCCEFSAKCLPACDASGYVHILRGVFWFGHPVSALDLVVEAGIHNHPGIRGATFAFKQILMSSSARSGHKHLLTDVFLPKENISQSRMP